MTLSEAIRLGAMMKPQGRRGYFDGQSTCAIGAAADAIGRLTDLMDGRLVEMHEWRVLSVRVTHPMTQFQRSLWNVVTELNDHCGWTREEIADLVEQVERESAAGSGAAVLVEIGTQ